MRKIKIFALFITLTICCLLCSCMVFGGFSNHTCQFGEWEEIEEPTCTTTGYEERYCSSCGARQERTISTLPHKPTSFEGLPPTCTSEGQTAGTYCSECRGIISGIQKIPAPGHTIVIDPAVPVTESTPGRTEGKHCSVCKEIIVKQFSVFWSSFDDQNRYHGDYAYKSLLMLEDGESMAAFYSEIDEYASAFHSSLEDAKCKKNGENDIYYMAEVRFSDNDITSEQALSVWSAYIKDHPLYYWISSHVTYTEDYLTVQISPEYIDGETREQINCEIYLAVEKYIESLGGETEYYDITLGLHDIIIDNVDYAYQSDGITPSYEVYAHNILGVLLEGEGVCESYAKTYQMLLNYLGIENIYVTGYAGEPHAWNMVRMDDGNWYWFDLTWDDQPDWMLGVRHNYFCVSNSGYVKWNDGSTSKTTLFLENHFPDSPGGVGVAYSYTLPDASNAPYDREKIKLRDDIIEQNGLSYVLMGYKSLALIDINKEGVVDIPETVKYGLDEYNVVCIGKFDTENKVFVAGSIIQFDKVTRDHIDVTEIHIPKSVKFIWDYSFDYCYTIERFSVSGENDVFTSLDGVLFTKSLYTLVKYPLAKIDKNYTVPEQTVEIAYGAFGDGGNVFCPEHLEKLFIPKTVEVIGAINGGRGFRDATPADQSEVIMLSGYLARLYAMLGIGGVSH